MRQKEKKKSIESNLNTQAWVNWLTYLKTVLRNQVFNYNGDELLKDDNQIDTIRELWRWITSVCFYMTLISMKWVCAWAQTLWLCYVMFSLFWFGLKQLYTLKYNLTKGKLQLQNRNPNIYIKNKYDLKYFGYYNYKILIKLLWIRKQL